MYEDIPLVFIGDKTSWAWEQGLQSANEGHNTSSID